MIEENLTDFDKLRNCRILDGSLTIANIKDRKIKSLSFPLLVEVTGFLKIQRTHFLLSVGDSFPNLSVIRGEELKENFALEVSDNADLMEIGLKSLRFIGNGNVNIRNNRVLCFAESINWSTITPQSTENLIEAGLNFSLNKLMTHKF